MTTYVITAVSSCTGCHAVMLLSGRTPGMVHGIGRHPVDDDIDTRHHGCDIRDSSRLEKLIREIGPDVVIHLAGCSNANQPDEMIKTNINGTWNLLSACQRLEKSVDVLLVGSAASFGSMRADEQSLGSLRIPTPNSLYGQTRQTALELGQLVNGTGGLRVFLCRTFNLTGPGLSDRYVPTSLLNRIRAASQRGENQIRIRDLDSVRDFIDVRDAVAAYLAILDHGRSGHPYSVGRGQGVTVRELATEIVNALQIDLKIVPDDPFTSNPRSGISRSIADPSDLIADTGWQAKFTLQKSIHDMLAQHQKTRF